LWAIAVALALSIAAAFLAVACGGTTGHEGLPQPGAGDDATVDADAAAPVFDAPIMYADRELPDIVAPPDTSVGAPVEGGPPWSCPPWASVACNGGTSDAGVHSSPAACNGTLTPIGQGDYQVPAQYDDAGNVLVEMVDGSANAIAVLYPEDSGCASYPWLGSTYADNCTSAVFACTPFPFLPPCNWCADAGIAKSGPGMGTPRYQLCTNLYECMMRTACATVHPADCLCGIGAAAGTCDAGGPCAAEELAALQYDPSTMTIPDVLTHLSELNNEMSANPNHGYCGSYLNYVFQSAITGTCFPDAGQ
jgi:hypothetical protein